MCWHHDLAILYPSIHPRKAHMYREDMTKDIQWSIVHESSGITLEINNYPSARNRHSTAFTYNSIYVVLVCVCVCVCVCGHVVCGILVPQPGIGTHSPAGILITGSPGKSLCWAQSCLTLLDPMDCNPPGFSVYGFFQAKIVEWVCHALLQAIFLTQRSSPCLLCLLHW